MFLQKPYGFLKDARANARESLVYEIGDLVEAEQKCLDAPRCLKVRNNRTGKVGDIFWVSVFQVPERNVCEGTGSDLSS